MRIRRIIGFHLFHANRRTGMRTLFFVRNVRPQENNNLIYVEKGRIHLDVSGIKIIAGKGCCLCFDPKNVSRCRTAPEASYVVLAFRLADADNGSPALADLGFPPAWKAKNPRRLLALMRGILDRWSKGGKFLLPDCSAAGLGLLKELARDALPGGRPVAGGFSDLDSRIDEVLMHVHTHFKRTFSVASLARKVSLHPVYFSRLFKKATGLSPNRYLLTQKIEKAKQMMALLDDPDPPKSAALELGFNYYPSFYRVFKKMTGMSPREFIKRQAVGHRA